jgi:hypothetical protein
LFCITHSIFISVLRFCFGLILLSTSSFSTCECGHRLDASGMHLIHCLFKGQQITTHDTIWNVMYAFAWKSEHIVWRKLWHVFMLRVSLQANLHMTWKDQIFVVDVVVIDLLERLHQHPL